MTAGKKRKRGTQHEVVACDNKGATSPWVHYAAAAATFVLPFLVLYWLMPFIGKYTIGNDYLIFWIQQQLYLHFSVRHGAFPLYAPGFAGGRTASALTLGQLWHLYRLSTIPTILILTRTSLSSC